MRTAIQLLLSFALGLLAPNLWAADQMVTLPLARSGVSTSYCWMPREGAKATLLLISGGSGGMGFDGKEPKSDNFLVRTRELFASKGFNVAVLGLSSDMRNLNPQTRTSLDHAQDLLAVVKALKAVSQQPVWLVGTSQGAIFAATAAIFDQGKEITGVVLTSSFGPDWLKLRGPGQADQSLDGIKVPTLVYHHKKDGCITTLASDVAGMMAALSNAPIKKL